VLVGLGLLVAILSRASAPLPAATPIPPRTVSVVVTTRDLPIRSLLESGDLTLLQVPVQLAPLDALGDPQAAVGRITMIPLVTGEVVAEHHLADPSNVSHDLAFIIDDDQVLMAFPATDLMSRINILQPGDRVDILASLDQPVLPGPATTADEEPDKELFTFSALQRVEISAVVVEAVPAARASASRTTLGEATAEPQPGATPQPSEVEPQAILIALSAQDALVLKYIKDAGGVIDIVLRAPTSAARFELNPVMAEYLRDRFELVISR
jgi:pilus assembly protein CpaB